MRPGDRGPHRRGRPGPRPRRTGCSGGWSAPRLAGRPVGCDRAARRPAWPRTSSAGPRRPAGAGEPPGHAELGAEPPGRGVDPVPPCRAATSAWVIRPPGPVPVTVARSTAAARPRAGPAARPTPPAARAPARRPPAHAARRARSSGRLPHWCRHPPRHLSRGPGRGLPASRPRPAGARPRLPRPRWWPDVADRTRVPGSTTRSRTTPPVEALDLDGGLRRCRRPRRCLPCGRCRRGGPAIRAGCPQSMSAPRDGMRNSVTVAAPAAGCSRHRRTHAGALGGRAASSRCLRVRDRHLGACTPGPPARRGRRTPAR